jgi:hypothetical protein
MRWVRRVIAGLFWVIWLWNAPRSFLSPGLLGPGLLDIKFLRQRDISISNIMAFVALILVGVSIASMIRFFIGLNSR